MNMKIVYKGGLTPGKAPSKPCSPSPGTVKAPSPTAGKGTGTPPVKK